MFNKRLSDSRAATSLKSIFLDVRSGKDIVGYGAPVLVCYVGDSDVIFLFATFPLGVEFVQRKSCVIIRPLFFEGGKALSEL